MKVSVLGSGSDGNCIYIEHGATALLVDAGVPLAEIDRRLVKIGVVGHSQILALFLTHEHGDHARYARTITNRWHIPVIDRDRVSCNGLYVDRFQVPHDATASYGYVVKVDDRALGICLDCGCITPQITAALSGCDTIILGCDYDDALLDANPEYPAELKNRIRSNTGHLSNAAVADFLRSDWDGKAHTIILAHLSKSNNDPGRATLAAFAALQQRTDGAHARTRIIVSAQDEPTGLIEV